METVDLKPSTKILQDEIMAIFEYSLLCKMWVSRFEFQQIVLQLADGIYEEFEE